jgi:parallel beta-helix repeat protein
MARDSVGKQSPIQTVYYIFSQVGNINTGKGYTSIQTAVSDSLTLNGHIIEVLSGTYTENIIVNKKLIIRPTYNGDVTVQAADPSLSVFTVNSGGSGSIIQGFTIIGANQTNELGEPLNPAGIHLKSADNCTIINNTIKNNYYGVYLLDSSYNQVDSNVIMNNVNGVFVPAWCVSFEEYYSSTYLSDPEIFDYVWWEYNEYYFGMHSDSFYNKITQNSIRNNTKGVYITSDLFSDDSGSRDTQVLENGITSNNIGIYADCTNANIHFNRITGNNNSGLYMYVGAVDATDNWWGSNSPVINTNYSWWSNSDTCDIYYEDYESSQSFKPPSWILMEKFTPYLVLKVKPTSHKVSNGKVYESTITTDLTHNSAGEDTSSKGHVPDGIPTHFSTNKGTITNLSYIKNSKASSRLILDPNLQSGMTTITTTIDRQGVSTQVDRIAKAIINIISTATDTSTNQPLNLTYTIPLNESVSWVSVLWKENTNVTDPFKNKLEVIVNGKVVQSKVFTNSAYSYIKDYYSGTYGFIFFEAISSINRFLANVDDINSEEAQLFLGIYRAMLTTEDFNFIMNNRLYFTDEIHITLSYPGDSSQIINIDPGDGSNMINLGFGGNPIQRTSTVLYRNGGYQHCLGDPYDPNATFESREAGYEGVRSFAIVTTKVTDNILQYWLNEKDKKDANGKLLYPTGPMKAAYGTFLTSLLMIKAHDMVADAAATKFNVTWSRTTPIIVSVLDDSYDGYLTLECDHRFGMDVTGDPNNVIAFRFTCSAAINPIEYWVMKTLFPSVNSTLDDLSELCSSITIGLGQKILNGEMVDIFISNGYLVMKSTENDLFLVFDPETGIVRDVMINNSIFSYSTWCYSDQQTEWVRDLGESILDYGRNIMNILINGGGIIDLNQLATNTKNGLTGLISSSILSLERATIFLENNIPSYLLTPLLGFNMINLCCYNAIIIREEPYVVENIVGYLNSKKKYLVEDGVDVILFGASIVGTTLVSRMGIIGIVYTGCELLNDFRDHYVPMEYWQFFHHPKIWETKTYTLCHLDSSSTPIWDEPTINVEVPYKGDGSLDWDNAVYIHSVTGARKVNSTQLKELTNGYWWNNPPYFGFTQCPIP